MDIYQTKIWIALISFTAAFLVLLRVLYESHRKVTTIAPGRATKHHKNPVMSPQSHNEWEAVGTFNPAAVKDDSGRVHILYRAIGSDGVSRVGYASSADGTNFDERLTYPVFAMRKPRENITDDIPEEKKKLDLVMYSSGGSWGGCEDPRMVRIDDKIYMTFNAFDGWDFIRIGVSVIKADDFFAKKWKWSRPLFISPKNEVHKNWVLFPEKINGKFAVLHSITPEVQIDYVEKLEQLDRGQVKIKSVFKQQKMDDRWDNVVRGAGPPPIKTDRGWLVLYHAFDKKESHIGYKLGAMLLDLNDPKKILARSPAPILAPDEWYENDWKPGVVYACGAAEKDGTLYVYYGGGDKHVCVAHVAMNELVDWLVKNGSITK